MFPKGAPDTVPGVLKGYKLLPGGIWEKQFKVTALCDFIGMDFTFWSEERALPSVQTTREIVGDGHHVKFPLYEEYERANRTIDYMEGEEEEGPPEERGAERDEPGDGGIPTDGARASRA